MEVKSALGDVPHVEPAPERLLHRSHGGQMRSWVDGGGGSQEGASKRPSSTVGPSEPARCTWNTWKTCRTAINPHTRDL